MKDTGVIITLKRVKEHKDGSATFDMEYNSRKLHPIVRGCYGKKRCSKRMVRTFILEGLRNYVDNYKGKK